ncbi:MAG TPA: hypothetical protein DDY52_02845 [Candidatus Moranbacteria bacterium]|nr:hypothetical protein [Candidatus Moranbacteria bacterium]
MKKILSLLLFFGAGIFFLILMGIIFFVYFEKDIFREKTTVNYPVPSQKSFKFQSIDTMKYSRDLSREKLDDSLFDLTIDKQIEDIAKIGATHVAIATPYDDEFLPILKRWVRSARKHNLKVWFRGNWSGWEGWFDYPRISKEEHLSKTSKFILNNPNLFEDGDAFSSCPECENGGPGDPRQTGDAEGYKKFLIDEYRLVNSSFAKINKEIITNLFSMNGDVAELIMDKNTTKSLGKIVTIDHYTDTPKQLIKDADYLAKKSGGQIVLGEFGVPIPDINGEMTEKQQARWIGEMLFGLEGNKSVVGVNYWLNVGGSTGIWKEDGTATLAVEIIRRYFDLNVVYGLVYDELNNPMKNVKIEYGNRKTITDKSGYYELKFPENSGENILKFLAPGYFSQEVKLKNKVNRIDIVLTKEHKNIIEKSILKVREWLNDKAWANLF